MRPALIILALVVITLGVGCTTTAMERDEGRSVSRVGMAAANVATSRVLEYDDRIARLKLQIEELEKERAAMLADARDYFRESSETAFDTGLTTVEREANSAQYRLFAERRKIAAANCTQLISAHRAEIAILSSRANQQKVDAESLRGRRMAE